MLTQVLWLVSWPVLIVVSYLFVKFAMNKYEQSIKE